MRDMFIETIKQFSEEIYDDDLGYERWNDHSNKRLIEIYRNLIISHAIDIVVDNLPITIDSKVVDQVVDSLIASLITTDPSKR